MYAGEGVPFTGLDLEVNNNPDTNARRSRGVGSERRLFMVREAQR